MNTIRSPNCFCCLITSLLAASSVTGCAPDLRTQQINEICTATDEAAIKEFIASGEHHQPVGQGDESVADRWWYPIHIAAFENNSVALQLLLEAGVDPDLQDADQATPLIQLFRGEDGDTQRCIDLLVKAGADVNLSDHRQRLCTKLQVMAGMNA